MLKIPSTLNLTQNSFHLSNINLNPSLNLKTQEYNRNKF